MNWGASLGRKNLTYPVMANVIQQPDVRGNEKPLQRLSDLLMLVGQVPLVPEDWQMFLMQLNIACP